MDIIWSTIALARVKEILVYYNSKSSVAASRLVKDIKLAANSLSQFPQKAAIESIFAEEPIAYRSLVVRDNYKIIYYIDEDKKAIMIVTVWDCRQDNKKLADELS